MPKKLLAVMLCGLFAIPAAAQTWSAAQTAALKVVTDSWVAIAASDVAWSDRFVHENAVVWSDQDPMPLKRASVKKWDGFEMPQSTIKVHEISPAGIVVEGSTAVVHYHYSLGVEDSDGDRTTVHGRCSDILVRTGSDWKFLAWNCGEQDSGDDD